MDRWKTTLQPTHRVVRLLVTDREGSDVLKAVLPPIPQHPRALLTVLEGLALWSGQPLTVAISAGPPLDRRFGEALFGDGLLPIDSALVNFEFLAPPRKRRKIIGVGDFRQLRLLNGRWL